MGRRPAGDDERTAVVSFRMNARDKELAEARAAAEGTTLGARLAKAATLYARPAEATREARQQAVQRAAKP